MAENIGEFSPAQKGSSILVNQTYSYINNTGFYALADPVYYNYFYKFVRRFGWWYDRYVPDFHNDQQGYFSTGIAHSLVDCIANQIVGRSILLQNRGQEHDKSQANETLKKAYKWADGADLTNKIRMLTKYAGALGTSMMKLNVKEGDIWLEPLRMDDFFFETSFDGTLESATCLVKSYTNTDYRNSDITYKDTYGDDQRMDLAGKYYLVEKRYFKNIKEVNALGVEEVHRVPFARYQIKQYRGSITNAQTWCPELKQDYNINSIPKNVLNQFKRDYSVLKLDEEVRLPFDNSLGCWLYRYNYADGSLSQQPFGQSILTDILSFCIAYDLAFSYFVRDMYQGKGMIFIAKELQTKFTGTTPFNGLEDSFITWLTNINDGKLPIDQLQFNMRIAEWREARNFLYENIASHLGISPTSVAGYLSDNSARTAKEVSTESSATDNYIDIQRGILAPQANAMLDTIGQFYGWTDKVEIRFSKSGSQNMDTIIDRAIKLKQAGLTTPFDALKMIMTDADEWEIEEANARLSLYEKEQQTLKANTMFGMDFTGNVGVNDG